MSLIDICMCCDKNYLIPTEVAIKSLLKNTKYSHLIRLNILCDSDESMNKLQTKLKNIKKYKFNLNIKVFIPSQNLINILSKIDGYCKSNRVSNSDNEKKNKYSKNLINNISNYSRFYFKSSFEYLDKIIYLDSDILVLGDIYDLYQIHFSKKISEYVKKNKNKPYFIATPTKNINLNFYNWESPNSKKIKKFIKKDNFIFNAGVYITELNKWGDYSVISKIENYLDINYSNKDRLFFSGTQPPLNLVFYDYLKLEEIWNYIPKPKKKKEKVEDIIKKYRIIHFKGINKPWNNNHNKISKLYGMIWKSYLN